jgi:hypothetical protein
MKNEKSEKCPKKKKRIIERNEEIYTPVVQSICRELGSIVHNVVVGDGGRRIKHA